MRIFFSAYLFGKLPYFCANSVQPSADHDVPDAGAQRGRSGHDAGLSGWFRSQRLHPDEQGAGIAVEHIARRHHRAQRQGRRQRFDGRSTAGAHVESSQQHVDRAVGPRTRADLAQSIGRIAHHRFAEFAEAQSAGHVVSAVHADQIQGRTENWRGLRVNGARIDQLNDLFFIDFQQNNSAIIARAHKHIYDKLFFLLFRMISW